MDKTLKIILIIIGAMFALLFVLAIIFVAYSVFIVSWIKENKAFNRLVLIG